MTRSLRIRHRLFVSMLLLLLPLLFYAALRGRNPVPAVEDLPAALVAEAPIATAVLLEADGLWSGLPLHSRLLSDGEHLVLELSPAAYLKYPELLLYWTPDAAVASDRLPDNAYFIGRLANDAPAALHLPTACQEHDGSFIIYSLAQQQVVAVAAIATASLRAGGGTP